MAAESSPYCILATETTTHMRKHFLLAQRDVSGSRGCGDMTGWPGRRRLDRGASYSWKYVNGAERHAACTDGLPGAHAASWPETTNGPCVNGFIYPSAGAWAAV